ncbi:MAG: sulfatase-like hydrolase/transferase, partial [Chloroflexi bacterium]|nr:sulfatase-like hydrolase/transferase [Chloroflexota bacterium]
MGWGQPGFNGGMEVATPSMDRIANEGVTLAQFCVQPVCSPTRASLLTGRYAWKNGMELRPSGQSSHGMLLDERTIADAVRDADYATWMVGKWHLGHWRREHLPLQRGFDHHYGLYSPQIDSFTHTLGPAFDWHRNGRPVVESGYSTFLLADEAVRLIERHDGRRPFFLYLPFNAPHVPHQAPEEYLKRYRHLDNGEQRAQLKAMDVAMGRVMDALDIKGVLDDTLIMFLNDNGGTRKAGRNRPYRGTKGQYYEGGIRVPAVLRWPGNIPPGSQSDALLHVVDLFTT